LVALLTSAFLSLGFPFVYFPNIPNKESVRDCFPSFFGTGSWYQAAILAELGAEVYSIEIIPELANHARKALTTEGYEQVKVLTGDGYKGWPEHSPFDAIIVTCAPEDIPQALVNQLKEGGRMILPLGVYMQRLLILRKKIRTYRKS